MLHTNPHEDRIIRIQTAHWLTGWCIPDLVPLRGFPNESLPRGEGKKIDFVLLAYFALWYLGNYYYNITNKSRAQHLLREPLIKNPLGDVRRSERRALTAAGGVHGFPMTIATLQARSFVGGLSWDST